MTDRHLDSDRSAARVLDDEIVVDLRDGATEIFDRQSLARRDVPFVDVGLEYRASKEAIDAALHAVIDRGDFVLGSAVRAFESEFAAYCGTDHAIGVDSGYSALELIIRGYGIGPGDEVITAANTFVATVGAIEATGATPRLVDVDPKTFNLDADLLASAVTPATKAVIPVHLYGQPADMLRIRAVADQHNLRIIEDACQAHGARYQGVRAGDLGDAAAFSFYPSKNLGAFGDGGMVVTSDEELAARIRLLRNLGSREKYLHEMKGFNRRLDSLHAAVLSVKLTKLDQNNASRAGTARVYDELLSDTPVSTPWTAPDGDHVYHLYVIETSHRDPLSAFLHERGVSAGIHYPVPIHLQQGYEDLGYGTGDFPVTEGLAGHILSLPMFPHMPLESVVYVGDSVRAFYESA